MEGFSFIYLHHLFEINTTFINLSILYIKVKIKIGTLYHLYQSWTLQCAMVGLMVVQGLGKVEML